MPCTTARTDAGCDLEGARSRRAHSPQFGGFTVDSRAVAHEPRAPTDRLRRERAPETAGLETLYGAIADGALEARVGKQARKELEAYLDCGVLGRGFARLRCGECKESRASLAPTSWRDSGC